MTTTTITEKQQKEIKNQIAEYNAHGWNLKSLSDESWVEWLIHNQIVELHQTKYDDLVQFCKENC